MINYYFNNRYKDSNNEQGTLKPYTFQMEANENTLAPDNATRIEPPKKYKGFIACWNGESWYKVEDNREKTAYSIETKKAIIIDYLGEIKEGFTLLEPFEFCKWNGEAWELDEVAKKQASIPKSLTRFQARRVLKSFKLGDSTLFKLTDDFISNLDSSIETNDAIIDAWNDALVFERSSPTILMAQKMFNLTDDQVDDMFIQGAEIVG